MFMYENKLYKRDKEDKIFHYMQNRLYTELIRDVDIFDHKKKILDVGCGIGGLIPYTGGMEYYGIDISKPNIKEIKKIWPNEIVKVKRGDIREKLPYETDTFDVVICTEVLEHLLLPDMRKLLKEIRRVTKRGGKIIISVPNIKYIWGFMPWSLYPFKRRFKFNKRKYDVITENYDFYHVRYNPEWFKGIVELYLNIEEMETTFWYNNRAIHGIFKWLQLQIHKFSWRGNLGVGNNIIMRCKKL